MSGKSIWNVLTGSRLEIGLLPDLPSPLGSLIIAKNREVVLMQYENTRESTAAHKVIDERLCMTRARPMKFKERCMSHGKSVVILCSLLLLVVPAANAGVGGFMDCVMAAARSYPYGDTSSWRNMCFSLSPTWYGSCYNIQNADFTTKFRWCHNILYDESTYRNPIAPGAGQAEDDSRRGLMRGASSMGPSSGKQE